MLCLILIAVVLCAAAAMTSRARVKARLRTRRVRASDDHSLRQRVPELEARIKTVLASPTQKYGEIFTSYAVWKVDRQTRLELNGTARWGNLNEFTRSLVVRYLWRVLESLSAGSVVVVDHPPQEWNDDVDSHFQDQGFDWRTFGLAPQFVEEP
jgi:hypothetical protein